MGFSLARPGLLAGLNALTGSMVGDGMRFREFWMKILFEYHKPFSMMLSSAHPKCNSKEN